MINKEIKKVIEKSIKNLQNRAALASFKIPEVVLDYSQSRGYGDYATTVALQLAQKMGKSAIEVAQSIKEEIENQRASYFDRVEVANGFLNFFLSKEYLQSQVREILKQGKKFGQIKFGKNQKINVEYISANPTGPLTLGNGRGGFCGDVLANILEKAGFKVCREYYINDIGEQINKLGHSVIGDEQSVYKGKYIEELRRKIKNKNPEEVGRKAAEIILKDMIKPIVKKMGVQFDIWFPERSLYKKGAVDKVIVLLKRRKLIYEKDGASWFNSAKFGDIKDWVLVKSDGEQTYFLSDIAYLKNKFERGFKKLFYFVGADHQGYVGRMKAAAQALGYKKEQIMFVVMQLVRLFEKGKEVRMSKRTGVYVTLEELIDAVGLDVARFFFLTKATGTHLNFDMTLAKQKSQKNPVYYVQYAHARICSILGKIKGSAVAKIAKNNQNLKLLNHQSELNLIKQLIRFPTIIEDTANDYQVQRIPQYAIDIATSFHQFYRDCKVISKDKNLTQDRLLLILATKNVLKNTLDLMGISAPEKM